MDLAKRLQALGNALGKFDPNDIVPWQTAAVFNALLKEAKKQLPSDPVVSVIEPVTGDENYSNEQAGSMRALVGQIYEAAQGR